MYQRKVLICNIILAFTAMSNVQENSDLFFAARALQEAVEGVTRKEGGPFGAVIVRHGQIITAGNNQVLLTNDPTAHAEIVAIRRACLILGTHQLQDCIIYSSCEPCPMCLGAIYWTRFKKLVYSATREDAARAGFDDSYIYQQLSLAQDQRGIESVFLPVSGSQYPFEWWTTWGDKDLY